MKALIHSFIAVMFASLLLSACSKPDEEPAPAADAPVVTPDPAPAPGPATPPAEETGGGWVPPPAPAPAADAAPVTPTDSAPAESDK